MDEKILNNAEETTVSEAEANNTEKAKLPDPPLNDENIYITPAITA